MSISENTTTPCVVKHNSSSGERQAAAGSSTPESCQVVAPVSRLMALGLSAGEIDQLGLDDSTLGAICEYARLDYGGGLVPATGALEATLDTLAEETKRVDLELGMLNLRKRALSNRAKLLHKLACTLESQAHSPIHR